MATTLLTCNDDDDSLDSGEGEQKCLTPESADFVRPFTVDEEEYPFCSCAFETGVGLMHYLDEGPKDAEETILMVHGDPTWSFLYRNIAKDLIAQGYRVVIPDHIGMGMSNVPSSTIFDYRPSSHSVNLENLVTALDLNEVTLVVQDWGGPIGLGMAGRQPERIKNILIMNTWSWEVDANQPGDYHLLAEWGLRAKNMSNQDALFFCNTVIPANADALANENDPDAGELFDKISHAYRAPAINEDGTAKHPEPCIPMELFAESILDDPTYLRSVEGGMTNLRGKSFSMYFGYRDRLFGALRCNQLLADACPDGAACGCIPEWSRSPMPSPDCSGPFDADGKVCLQNGEFITPGVDKFIDLLGESNLVELKLSEEANHMIQEWDPVGVVASINYLLDNG